MRRLRTMRDVWDEQKGRRNGNLSELTRRLAKLKLGLSIPDGRYTRGSIGNIPIDNSSSVWQIHKWSPDAHQVARHKTPYRPELEISCEPEVHENQNNLLVILYFTGISMTPNSKFIRSYKDYGKGNSVYWRPASPYSIILATLYDIIRFTVLREGQRFMRDRGVYSREEYIRSLGVMYDPESMNPSICADRRTILVEYALCHNEKSENGGVLS